MKCTKMVFRVTTVGGDMGGGKSFGGDGGGGRSLSNGGEGVGNCPLL